MGTSRRRFLVLFGLFVTVAGHLWTQWIWVLHQHWVHPQCFNQLKQPGTRDPYILNVDVDLYYSWHLKGKFVIFFFFSCNLPRTFRSLPDSQSLCFTARCPKQLHPAKRLAPAGRRNKLPWMEESFLEESLLSCLGPETRHFPSEVQETILDRSRKFFLPHASTQQHANGQRSYCLIGHQDCNDFRLEFPISSCSLPSTLDGCLSFRLLQFIPNFTIVMNRTASNTDDLIHLYHSLTCDLPLRRAFSSLPVKCADSEVWYMTELQRSTRSAQLFCGVTTCVEQEGHVNGSGHLTSLLILPESVFNVIINVLSSNICVFLFCQIRPQIFSVKLSFKTLLQQIMRCWQPSRRGWVGSIFVG